VWTCALMLVVGVPVYVCAVASTPVAAGLVAGGVSPGAATGPHPRHRHTAQR